MHHSPSIWSGPAGPGAQTRLFRRIIEYPEPVRSAQIHLFAESRYHLWVNGQYIGRGPVFHHPHRRPPASYDVTHLWRQGRNVIAVLVHAPNLELHNHVPAGKPGLIARIHVKNEQGQEKYWDSDSAWRVTDRTGRRQDVPRRGWALGFVEAVETAGQSGHWMDMDFDDSAWPPAQLQPASDHAFQWIDGDVPPLRWQWQSAEPISIHAVDAAPYPLHSSQSIADSSAFGRALDDEFWSAEPQLRFVKLDDGGLRLEGLTRQRGAALCLDLGREYVGQVMFECDCPNDGLIDIGWSELLVNGRPPLLRKGCSYADRLYAAGGFNRWEPIGFSGARYLVLIFRGFEESVTLRHVGMRATEPDLNWPGAFHCDDERLNDIWRLCVHTLQVGVQEGLMDCPTREQAPYLGDGNLMGRWMGLLTGDWRHWRYLIRESFVRQSPDGLLRDSVFSGVRRSLVDYNLLAVIGVRDYLRLTGDLETLHHVLPGCRKVFQWFNQRRDARGLIHTHWERMRIQPPAGDSLDPQRDRLDWATNLLIDHPGLGWHNKNEPGIDRRGTNTAINALYVVAARAMAELEEKAGHAGQEWRDAAQATASALEVFFNPAEAAFSDGQYEGGLLNQISQQTNTWCLWAGAGTPREPSQVMRRVLQSEDRRMARNGPYFWAYTFPVMAHLGMHREALDHLRELWGRMIDAGATTLWETFAGDELDSRCHPWSAAPLEFLLCHVLGLGGLLDSDTHKPAYRPRFDLLSQASGTLATPHGPASIRWIQAADRSILIAGELPSGMTATLILPDGAEVAQVRGAWEHRVKSA